MNKILFSSLCIGELYLNWAVICVRSFINACGVLTTPITWEFCTTEEFEECFHNFDSFIRARRTCLFYE